MDVFTKGLGKQQVQLLSDTVMAGPYSGAYYSYGNQPFFNSGYNYYNDNSYDVYSDPNYNAYGPNYGAGYDGYGGTGVGTNLPPFPPQFPPQRHFPQSALRQRTPTPPPPPAEPSPEYLAASLSAQPSSIPPGQRKLVIFDLNGTLLLRSARARSLTRKIYLRPYAGVLVAFLAHPAVRTWLDCMVWSSAQPHNVSEMVDRVFGAGEGAGVGPILRAVWARDTLGLGRVAFHQKTQTTKDLAKPWAFFAAPRSPESEEYSPTTHGAGDGSSCRRPDSPNIPSLSPPRPSSLLPSSSHLPSSSPQPSSSQIHAPWPDQPADAWASDAPAQQLSVEIPVPLATDSAPPPPPYPHGPETTLLVDDSPLKVRLQPYNHLCVAEYDAPTRRHDRAVAQLPPDVPPTAFDAAQIPLNAHPFTPGDQNAAGNAEPAEGQETEELNAQAGSPKARKGKKRKRAEAVAAKTHQTDVAAEGSTDASPEGVDAAAQDGEPPKQSKRTRERQRRRERKAAAVAASVEGTSEGAPVTGEQQQVAGADELTSSASSDVSLSPVLRPNGLSTNDTIDRSTIDNKADSPTSPPTSSPTVDAASRSKKRKRHSESEIQPEKTDVVDAPPPCEDGEPYDPTLLAVVGVLAHVRSVGNVAAWVRSGGLAAVVSDADADTQKDAREENPPAQNAPALPSDPVEWFTSRRLLVAWAARGRAALAELGIAVVPGVQ
ncbi:hypothetical protein C8R47DRAFT_1236633 [Mycena vitilis]|nr:hypothetical protein C8R47DRAFT_1236633 [Mycena vitilis]